MKDNLIQNTLNDSWTASESWKLVRSAEKEMYRKMRKESKIIKGRKETSEYTEETTNSNLEEKIEKLQSLPNITPQGDIFTKHSRKLGYKILIFLKSEKKFFCSYFRMNALGVFRFILDILSVKPSKLVLPLFHRIQT